MTTTQIIIGIRLCFTKFLWLADPQLAACSNLHPAHLRYTSARQPSHFASLRAKAGGEGGIRTPVRLSPEAVFKTAAIDHSATSPKLAESWWRELRVVHYPPQLPSP